VCQQRLVEAEEFLQEIRFAFHGEICIRSAT
jgi:hypothetical protein